MQNKWRSLIYVTKAIIIAQALLLALGIVLFSNDIIIPYYFETWLLFTVVSSFVQIILLLTRKPEGYVAYALCLLLYPVLFVVLGFISIFMFSGITC